MRVRYSFSARRTRRIEGKNNHKIPFKEIVEKVIDLSDIVLEIIDIRYIEKTRDIELEERVKERNKIIIYVLNKADLIDINNFKFSIELKELNPYVIFSCKSRIGKKQLLDLVKINAKKLKLGREAVIGVIGYPNTGKSSIINFLAGKKSTRTSSEAGFTKGKQSIRLSRDLVILDTPGVVPEKEESMFKDSFLKKHTEIGVIRYNQVKDPDFVVFKLMQENPNLFENFYKIEAKGDAEVLIEELGRKMNLLRKGNQVDVDRAARLILKDWQEGKIK